jgi:hypothetical protein
VIDRAEVLALFARQFWVADVCQLTALGVSPSTIKRARRRGSVVSVLPGVVWLAGSPDSFESRAMALQLHGGPRSYVSGVSAGVSHGLRNMPRSIVEITLAEHHPARVARWARQTLCSWTEPERDVLVRVDGLRVASPLRCCCGSLRPSTSTASNGRQRTVGTAAW